MTNNPTIDGVSRGLIEMTIDLLQDLRRGTAVERKLRALLDAPAVERQDEVAFLEMELEGERRAKLELADVLGVGDEPRWKWMLSAARAQQSTIARLEARIAELESGRGEPVAWMYKREGGEILGQLVQMESDNLKCIRLGKCHDDGTRYMWPREDYIEWTPLFTAPPAPVATPEKYDDVLLPFLSIMRAELHANAHKGDRPGWLQMDRKTAILEVFYHMGKLHQAVHCNETAAIKEYAADVANMCMMLLDVCACLDATAALNGPAK